LAVLGRWQLHPLHLYLVRSYLQLDDLTLPLEGPAYGSTYEQLGEVGRREQPTMERLGILVDDEIDPPLAAALQALTKPYLWVDSMWFPQFGGEAAWRTVAAVTAAESGETRIALGVQAPGENERFGGMLTVEVHEKVSLPQVLLPTLPPAPPGNRGAARVPATSLKPDQQRDDGERESLLESGRVQRPRSTGDQQVALYHAIGEAPHVRAGQIAANLRDPNGRVRRSQVLRWFDNAEPDGRYLDHSERGSTGETMFMLTPADARLIASTVDGLVKSVR
jgi:hypothetical protein